MKRIYIIVIALLSILQAGESTFRKQPYLIYPGSNTQMKIVYQLYDTDSCSVLWGLDSNTTGGSMLTEEISIDHRHNAELNGLLPDTKYYYKVSNDSDLYRGSFTTAPDSNETAIKFFVYGDTRTYPQDHDKVAEQIIEKYSADSELHSIILSVGDLVGNGDYEGDWDNQFFNQDYPNIMEMLGNLPYQSCIGNHEKSGILFKKYFPYPFVNGRYWSFDYGPAHFVVVDQYTNYSTGSEQLNWIENDLSSTDKIWKIMMFHEPGWSAGGHGNEIPVQNYLQPLCEEYNVQIVFAGHNHYYARAEVNDVTHITTGGGGAPIYSADENYPNIVTATSAHHYCIVSIDNNSLFCEALDINNSVLDSFTIEHIPEEPVAIRVDENFPQSFKLEQNYPNPFNASTSIRYQLPKSSFVNLKVYAVNGEFVDTLINDMQATGYYKIQFNADDLPSGRYIYRLTAGNKVRTRKMTLVK
ncbi:MAG: metallophosphoesterase [Candidatus Marinimicrobia bacterium]|nr:metallophosphoesterase [Candidatus Neomarinimicrobiota bacterium]